MEMAYDCSSIDYPVCVPGEIGIPDEKRDEWVENVWGREGLERIIDTILATGSRRIHFRSHCAGPWWPTKIPGAAPGGVGRLAKPSFSDWNPVIDAVEIAHGRAAKIIGWFDLSEGHAGYPTSWALSHPDLCVVNRDGVRLDGPGGLVGHGGVPFNPDLHLTLRDLVEGGFTNEDCERPDGAPIDPELSLAYPEVVEYRKSLLQELLSFGVDGVFLTVGSCVGYEKPVVESFEEGYGLDPRDLPETDSRWVEHQGGYFTRFMRQVAGLVRREEDESSRKIEIVLEGQGAGERDQEPETGLSRVPGWASMPDFVDLDSLALESLIDSVCLWTFREIDALSPTVRERLGVATRYRYMYDTFSREAYQARREGARQRTVSTFILNEPRVPLLTEEWIYPDRPGPLYTLAQDLLRP